uniref:ATP synthase complex subunit 8 n=1 Tax=Staphylinoidea sp. 12 KM-2017 TaxID=2219452 RepID=A0A346RFI9_9COLE|nr:ATP synthase F0 subunit 8 [Staphylinoidea sp. 12 KM-2017]
MPQMAPMNWLLLFIMFIIMFLMINLMNFYSFKYAPKNFKKKISSYMNWKW